ncbi:MAG: tRNA pseudouridine(13) synthase TruD [Candidatus Calescibacterium sp.]|nr:tRNA pseudouridine(13) synthase TruD [Candidatus Calescibacterium sp.]MDW8133253.1 tRNA pseudouridine(13) synthase TruD [Candidatus Calescibacterium sp.]
MIIHKQGIVKYQEQDFIVSEKIIVKSLKGKNYSVFLLKKNNCSLFNVIMRLSKILKVPISNFHFFGEKDKYAITKQILYTPKLNFLEEHINSRDFELIHLFDVEEIDSSWMIGNKFNITVRKISNIIEVEEKIKKIINREIKIPNYYDIQRFGKRYINHIIGYYLLNSKYYEATYLFLCAHSKNENHKVKKVRKILKDLFNGQSFNIHKALEIKMPQYMDIEKIFLKILSKNNNFKKTWKEFPYKWTSLFKEAFYSYKFNKSLADYIKNSNVNYFIQKYEINVPEEFHNLLSNFENRIELVYPLVQLDFQKLSLKDLKNRNPLLEPLIYKYNFEKDELFEGYYKLNIEFFLSRGSFATNFLNFILGG